MNRKQRACIKVGFLLLILATLFPPWTYSYRPSGLPSLPRLPRLPGSRSSTSSSSYGFLFYPPFGGATVNLNHLFVEWAFIALVTSGAFLSQGKEGNATSRQDDPLVASLEPDQKRTENPPTAEQTANSLYGRSFFKLEFPGAPEDLIADVDAHDIVTIWDNGNPLPAKVTRAELEARGMKFKTAVIADITKHYGQEYLHARNWKRKSVIALIIAFTFCVIGLVYYGSRRIVRNLPAGGVSKLAGEQAYINYGSVQLNIYNASDFVLTEVMVSISVFDEKGNVVISNRVYRLFPSYPLNPQSSGRFSADLGFTLGQGQTWQFSIVGAKGRPE